MSSDGPRRTLVNTVIAGPPATQQGGSACIVQIYGPQLGKRLEVGAKDIVLGRDAGCDVQLDDDTVSRRHATFRQQDGGYAVHDLGSTNGTLVNNVPIRAHCLRHGDEVKVGQTIYKFLCAGSTEAQYHEVIYRLMTRDGLTEAHNRTSFEQLLGREISRARRYARALGLIALDIDHFKTINDTFGHMAGDEVLRQLGALVGRSVRLEDLFARVGGEEFVVLVPEGTIESCRLLAERLRGLIETTAFEFDGRRIPVTCSFGVAQLDVEADGTGELLRKVADERLYAAKAGGRNCVR